VKLLAKRGIVVDLLGIPLDDPKTYAMLSRAEAVGIFQLESGGELQEISGLITNHHRRSVRSIEYGDFGVR
jgi:DNA polymerase-3 subunit alpha